MPSKLLKTATLVLCMTVAGCSTLSHDKAASGTASKAEQADAGRSWWPFGADKAEKPAAKIDQAATQAWLDQYEPRLRAALKSSKFEVERRDNILVVIAPVDSSFNVGRRPGMLLPVALGPITQVAKLLESDPQTAVLVLGHADTSGDAKGNRELSQQRAQAVAAIFRLSGLQRDRLMLKGMGADMPRAANDSKEGRALNRRVEVVLTPQNTLVALLAKYNQPVIAEPALASSQSK
ncbi:OmpA family protein [Pseudomonas sp. UL073]|uniref:OmpA family protein n=1 Tax=Zestomonas insulae TaxID=2809017 RepID=A0ABS2IBL4_9GAMM|nr:OmpA family protein [Pseudomonas insulae]